MSIKLSGRRLIEGPESFRRAALSYRRRGKYYRAAGGLSEGL